MAIQKTIQLNNGLTAPNAYIRVDTVSGCKGIMTISVNSYLSEAAFKGEAPYTKQETVTNPDGTTTVNILPNPQPYLEQELHEFTPDVTSTGKNFIEQGYDYIKTLPKYAGATDC